MSTRQFEMRMQCQYSGSSNEIVNLSVDHKIDDQWEKFDLGITSAGFEVFVYAIFTCQHMYMRVNCAELGLQLGADRGRHAGVFQQVAQVPVCFEQVLVRNGCRGLAA